MKLKTKLALTAAVPFILAQAPAFAGEITWWAPEFGADRAETLAQKFEEQNPDIKVNVERVVPSGLQNRVLVALQSGNTPDLIDVANGWTVPFAMTGQLLQLDDIVAEQGIDLDDFLPAAVNTAKVDGKLYGLPFRAEAHAMIYNKGMFEKAGLDPDKFPETWSELNETASALTSGSQYGMGIAGGGEVSNTVFRSLPFLWMNGGGILSEDLSSSILDAPESAEALEFYTDFKADGLAPPSTLENDGTALRRLFIAETIAIYQSGQFDLASITQENPDIDIGTALIPHPEGKERSAILGGWNFVIPAAAKNKGDSAAFLNFLVQPENMGFYTDTFPARQSAMDMERFQNPQFEPFREMLQYARPQPAANNWVQITQMYFDTVQEILLGGADVKEVLTDTTQQIDSLLQ
ncbi:ABC transporter substrate-binding protein [Martelella mediterranea]|uniref:Carbohydrate ABC transporter substrate-binding protein (CUT1 family) n=1 Tax=Martelella mediterranea TaxID=293089 RepID=A0A4R3NPU4_9HYPH|nr:ABC transporter substrate-binding protein [Martelella mediterranea]TCT33005.1 carbohydrate ABC transporter substrate-binding protein (CUT1 family) [Martelella mediterranea]